MQCNLERLCAKAGLLSEKCKRCVTHLSHLPSSTYDHRDEDDNYGDNHVFYWLEMISSLMNNFAFASLV